MRISIITVCYNSAKTLEKTICSVHNQQYQDKEYIIIDGNSTDGTKDIIDKYKAYLAYWCSEPDKGLYDAMNKGIQHATGDVIAFLNSDDWYENDVLSRVNRYFEDMDIDMLSGDINYVINDTIVHSPKNNSLPEDIRIKIIYPHQAMFVKSKIFNEIGKFDLKYRIASDYDWILRAYMRGAKIKKVNDIFTNCREGGIGGANACACLLEQKKIAILNLNIQNDKASLDEIEKCYAEFMKDGMIMELCYKASDKDLKQMHSFLPEDKKYYIWGAGIWGERCYFLFKRLNLEIIGFIDSNKVQEVLHGLPVLKPEGIGEEGIICISPRRYEEEIVKELKLLGITKERYFSLSELASIVSNGGIYV